MKWGLGEVDTFVGDLWELATEGFITPIHRELRPAGQAAIDLLRRAGPEVEREILKQEYLPRGQSLISEAGSLDCKKLIHISVTSLSKRPTIELFAEAMHNALRMAYYNNLQSLAIPAMYIEPGELTTSAVARATVDIAMDHLTKARLPGRIVFVVPTEYVHKAFLAEMERIYYGEPLQ